MTSAVGTGIGSAFSGTMSVGVIYAIFAIALAYSALTLPLGKPSGHVIAMVICGLNFIGSTGWITVGLYAGNPAVLLYLPFSAAFALWGFIYLARTRKNFGGA